MSSPTPSTRLKTTHALLSSYSALSAPALLAHLSPTFTHQVLPLSLNFPVRDRAAFATHASHVTSVFKTFAMVPQTIFEDEANNAVVVYAKMVGELVELGHWENECVLMLRMAPDGESVVECREFVDSARANLLRGMLEGRGGKGKGEGEKFMGGE